MLHGLSQSTGLFAHLAQFNTRCEIGVEQVIFLIEAPHSSCAWPTNSIIRSTTEALRKRTQEKRSIDVPEEAVEVVVGGSRITVR